MYRYSWDECSGFPNRIFMTTCKRAFQSRWRCRGFSSSHANLYWGTCTVTYRGIVIPKQQPCESTFTYKIWWVGTSSKNVGRNVRPKHQDNAAKMTRRWGRNETKIETKVQSNLDTKGTVQTSQNALVLRRYTSKAVKCCWFQAIFWVMFLASWEC